MLPLLRHYYQPGGILNHLVGTNDTIAAVAYVALSASAGLLIEEAGSYIEKYCFDRWHSGKPLRRCWIQFWRLSARKEHDWHRDFDRAWDHYLFVPSSENRPIDRYVRSLITRMKGSLSLSVAWIVTGCLFAISHFALPLPVSPYFLFLFAIPATLCWNESRTTSKVLARMRHELMLHEASSQPQVVAVDVSSPMAE